MYYKIHNVETGKFYCASKQWPKTKDQTDASALEEAMKSEQTITMGKTIVEPVKARIKYFDCCCCGGYAPGYRQWWNRDAGIS